MTDPDFEAWLLHQEQVSIAGLAACLSPTGLTVRRPGFGQVIVPKPGSTVASPVTDLSTGEPDYFFHWLRDSALFMDAVYRLVRRGDTSRDWARLFNEFVDFSHHLNRQDGRALAADPSYRDTVVHDYQQFLRPADELSSLHGTAIPGDVRYNPDGTLDTINWSRPQDDGPAMRALVCLRFWDAGFTSPANAALIASDLAFTLAHTARPSVDIWEEVSGDHYYTRLAQYAALTRGASWPGAGPNAEAYRREANTLAAKLDSFWSAQDGVYLWSIGKPRGKVIDLQSVLGVIHTDLTEGPHSVLDDRALATLAALEAWCATDYPINHNRPNSVGIALGRYKGDRYVTAGPWYLCTFAAAEFRYRRASRAVDPAEAQKFKDAGDQSLMAAKRFIPTSGKLTEQFDPNDGRQSSARDLGWSHAAFLTAFDARRLFKA